MDDNTSFSLFQSLIRPSTVMFSNFPSKNLGAFIFELSITYKMKTTAITVSLNLKYNKLSMLYHYQ